jgi:hypothetical protein
MDSGCMIFGIRHLVMAFSMCLAKATVYLQVCNSRNFQSQMPCKDISHVLSSTNNIYNQDQMPTKCPTSTKKQKFSATDLAA